MRTLLKSDELNVLSYEYTDKIIRYLIKQIVRIFGNAKGVLINADEKEVLSYCHTMFEELYAVTYKAFEKLGNRVYKDNGGKRKLGSEWLDEFLLGYSQVTKYVWEHEFDRKEARFAEAVIASINRVAEIDAGMRTISRMLKQEAVEVTDAAARQAYKDLGVEEVIWVSNRDEKVCSICKKRDMVKYELSKVPSKHPNCRCWLIPYPFDDED